MLDKGSILVMVVRSILCILTGPLPIAPLWSTATNVAAPIPLYVLGAHKNNVIELCLGTELVPMLFMFSICPASRGRNIQSV